MIAEVKKTFGDSYDPKKAIPYGKQSGASVLLMGDITELSYEPKVFTIGVFKQLSETVSVVLDYRVVSTEDGTILLTGQARGEDKRTSVVIDDNSTSPHARKPSQRWS